jgi:hypothetical protein
MRTYGLTETLSILRRAELSGVRLTVAIVETLPQGCDQVRTGHSKIVVLTRIRNNIEEARATPARRGFKVWSS